MYCWNCRAQIPDGSDFCTQCGSRLTPPPKAEAYEQPYQYGQAAAVAPVTKKKSKKAIILISAGVLAVACAILIPTLIQSAREADYKQAFALVDSGKLPEAKQEFLSLGGYKDSEDMAGDCQNRMDYDEAASLMDEKNYAGAKAIYEGLGGYKDSESLAAECRNTMDYDSAAALMDAGSNEQARDAFLKLGGYSDSADRAAECQNRLDYASATELMNNGDLQGAVTAYTALGGYQDSAQLAADCQNKIDYTAAEDALSQGKYYTAYKMFNNLSGYSDSDARAQGCIQPAPANGELYRNPDYAATKCPITFKTQDDGFNAFLRIYDQTTDTLVSTAFIAPAAKTRVKLPKGSYYLNVAYGSQWFGQDERFGDDGYYVDKMTFDDGGETTSTFTLKSGYRYTLTLG